MAPQGRMAARHRRSRSIVFGNSRATALCFQPGPPLMKDALKRIQDATVALTRAKNEAKEVIEKSRKILDDKAPATTQKRPRKARK